MGELKSVKCLILRADGISPSPVNKWQIVLLGHYMGNSELKVLPGMTALSLNTTDLQEIFLLIFCTSQRSTNSLDFQWSLATLLNARIKNLSSPSIKCHTAIIHHLHLAIVFHLYAKLLSKYCAESWLSLRINIQYLTGKMSNKMLSVMYSC